MGVPVTKPLFKHHNVTKLLDELYSKLDKRKIRYYSKFVCTDYIDLNGFSKKSLLDGKI